jgi:hypothetical protein
MEKYCPGNNYLPSMSNNSALVFVPMVVVQQVKQAKGEGAGGGLVAVSGDGNSDKHKDGSNKVWGFGHEVRWKTLWHRELLLNEMIFIMSC